jgi:hypothetical protein
VQMTGNSGEVPELHPRQCGFPADERHS